MSLFKDHPDYEKYLAYNQQMVDGMVQDVKEKERVFQQVCSDVRTSLVSGKLVNLNGVIYPLVDQALAQPGDLCIEIEAQKIFVCGVNMYYEDCMLDKNGQIVYTNNDPHQIYKIDLENPYKEDKGYPTERQKDTDIEVHLKNGDVRYIGCGEDPDDYSIAVLLCDAPFSYIVTTTKQLELMEALAKVIKSEAAAERLIQYLNKLPV